MSIAFHFTGRPWLLPAIVLCFAVVHIAKLMRLYLIMLDERIPFGRFVNLYFMTTLVNLIIPYKLGEFFRMYKFSKTSGRLKIGVASVLIDRFFDTMALVIILLPLELLSSLRVTYTTLLLTAFIIVLIFLYRVFPSSYTYLNRYIIMRKTSRRSMNALKVLEAGMSVHTYVKGLIEGRYSLLILFSFAAWLMECLVIYLTSMFLGMPLTDNLSTYISSLISSSSSQLSNLYVSMCILLIGVAFIISTICYYATKGNKKNLR